MTNERISAYPNTPATVATAVLDAIEQNPKAFDMATWVHLSAQPALKPEDTPECGTTMCIAGWAAHLTGWTLLGGGIATKGHAREWIEHVADRALGYGVADLFHGSGSDALAELRKIAGR
ncbi:hypothetical protein ACIQRE_01810 [Streptomyces griseoluteus]|uniref:hypothetical protein n=1 Tax=Streptomyces griseoluteus TaxID=29306 RepID=UPI00381DE8DD